jgi:hypothetical protein
MNFSDPDRVKTAGARDLLKISAASGDQLPQPHVGDHCSAIIRNALFISW